METGAGTTFAFWQHEIALSCCEKPRNPARLPPTFCGPWDILRVCAKDTALAAFIRAKKTGKAITLTETTAQSTFRTGRRDFIYVKDVAKAFIATMLSDKTGNGEMINIGTGIMTTMEDIAKTIVNPNTL